MATNKPTPPPPPPDLRPAVRELLQTKSVPAQSWSDFLDVTELSQGLWGLRGVAINLGEMLDVLAPVQISHLPVTSLRAVCNAIIELESEALKTVHPSLCDVDKSGTNGYPIKDNLYTTHPLHCLIWHRGIIDQYSGDYVRFKSFAILIYRRMKDCKISQPDYKIAKTFYASCCLAARKIGRQRCEEQAELKVLQELRADLPRSQDFEISWPLLMAVRQLSRR